jgi:methyl-accepting chemotaxis protein
MKWFVDLSMRIKLLVSFVVIGTIAGVIGAVGIVNTKAISERDTQMYEHMVVPLSQLNTLVVNYHEFSTTILEMIASKDPSKVDTYAELIAATRELIAKSSSDFAQSILTKEMRDDFAALKEARTEIGPYITTVLDLARRGKFEEARIVWLKDAADVKVKEARAIDAMIDLMLAQANGLSEENSRAASSSTLIILVCMIAGVIASLCMGYFLSRMIVNPLHKTIDMISEMDRGNLTARLSMTRKDEIGQLAQTMDRFADSLQEALLEVSEVVSAAASAAAQISASTEEMAAGANEQTTQAGEVAAAVEEMTQTILENSKNASATSEAAKQSKLAAETGGRVVEETVRGMQRIARVVRTSADTVKALGKSSNQIGEITGVIDDIANQTNLLALNAAIEAARAGEHGRGFAVVADEVRKLAERTTKATKEIAGMIKQIQSETAGAVVSMEAGTREVETGIRLVDEAGMSLHEIVQTSQRVTDMIMQIASASEQQSSASEQIAKNVESISSVTAQTATGTQQVAQAANDLNRLTVQLHDLVARFKLSHDGPGSGSPVGERRSNAADRILTSDIAVSKNGRLTTHES